VNIPDLSNIVYIIFLIIPGFISLMIIQYIAVFERKLSDFEITVWSLFVSNLLLMLFSYKLNIRSFIDLQNYIFDFDNLLVINILGISSGFIFGMIIKLFFRPRILHGSPWNKVFEESEEKGAWVLIQTKTGSEILGKVFKTSITPSDREIVLMEPKKIERKGVGTKPCLKEIDGKVLINGKNISMIIIYNPEKADSSA